VKGPTGPKEPNNIKCELLTEGETTHPKTKFLETKILSDKGDLETNHKKRKVEKGNDLETNQKTRKLEKSRNWFGNKP